jgi:putative DNA primase/helicase
MATDFSNTGAFNVNGQWATTLRYEGTIDQGSVTDVQLRFFNGRSEVASDRVSVDDARELLGENNFAAIVDVVASARSGGTSIDGATVKGELRGKSLEFRQVTLPGHQASASENTIALDSRTRRKDGPSAEQVDRQETSATPDDVGGPAARGAADTMHDDARTASAPEPQPVHDADMQRDLEDQMQLRLARAAGVPDSVAQRFLRVDDKYYFPDKTLAFTDRGTRLKAETHNLEVIRSLVSIAALRCWGAISVTGTPEFRKEVWREASLHGIDVHGYDATELEREELRRAMEKRHGPNEVGHEAQRRAADLPSRAPVQSASTTPTRPGRDDDARTTLLTGRLIESGAAPYKFDPKEGTSYYVKLQTERGERIVWGIDLERALVESQAQVQVGDVVTIENRGSRRVTVKAPKRDTEGNVIGEKEISTHRNTWVIEKPSYFDERAEKATAFRNGETTKKELVQLYPDLTSAVVSLWLGEQFATKMIERPEDRERVVAHVKERLAQALERGEAINAPKLKQEVARELDTVDNDFDEIAKRTLVRTAPRATKPPRERLPEEPPHVRA